MKRLFAILACVIVVGLVVAAVAYGLSSDGPSAYSVRGTSVSQRSVDDELAELSDNAALKTAYQKAKQGGQQVAPLSVVPGSVTTDTSSGWLGLRIAQTAAAQAVEQRGLKATKDDKSRGHQLAVQSVTGDAVFSTLPDWFQQDLNERWTNVAVLEQDVLKNPTPELRKEVAALCPSGRYVSHILVDTEQQAASIKQALDRGGDFAEIAASTSKDGSAKNGGQLGCLDGQDFVEPFATVAKTQPIGVVSDPVQTQFGYHLILVTDQVPVSDVQQVAVQAVLGRTKGSAAVTVDQRYGRWDRRNGQVLPPVAPGAQASTLPAPAPGG
jgi:peptidyl-prolyl cis-trans isomerase C